MSDQRLLLREFQLELIAQELRQVPLDLFGFAVRTAESEEPVSRPQELPPRSLAEPCVNVFAHTAPIIQPLAAPPSARGRRAAALCGQYARASAPPAAYGGVTA